MTKDHKKGRVILIPTLLAEGTKSQVLPNAVVSACCSVDLFLVENIRSARRFLSGLQLGLKIESLQIEKIPDPNDWKLVDEILDEVNAGRDLGILSEAGCPGVADPGSSIVSRAHQRDLEVVPLVGPSSIILALMASGMNGQSFKFHGYLPIKKESRERSIRSLVEEVQRNGTTQIFIETPYRNQSMFDSLVKTCQANTMLCIATNLTAANMAISTRPVSQWKKISPEIEKQPSIFLLGRSDY